MSCGASIQELNRTDGSTAAGETYVRWRMPGDASIKPFLERRIEQTCDADDLCLERAGSALNRGNDARAAHGTCSHGGRRQAGVTIFDDDILETNPDLGGERLRHFRPAA